MEILLNDKNEILSFALVGGFDNGIQINEYPEDFIFYFKPKFFIYSDGVIKRNPYYVEEDNIFQEPPINNDTDYSNSTDKEVRTMFISLQKQVIQANISIIQLENQNISITKQLTEILKKLENIKEEEI